MERPAMMPSRHGGLEWLQSPQQNGGGNNVHVAQHGDTLGTIAQQYNTPLDIIRQLNPLLHDNLPIGLGESINLPFDTTPQSHTVTYDAPDAFSNSPTQPAPNAPPPVDTNPRVIDTPLPRDNVPRDTAPPPNGSPTPRGDDHAANASTPRADTAPTNPAPANNAPANARAETAPTNAPLANPTPGASNAAPNAPTILTAPTTAPNAAVPAQTAATVLAAAPLVLVVPQTNATNRGEAALPPRLFDAPPPTLPNARDASQNAGAERRDMPRLTDADARLLPQARSDAEKPVYDASRLLRDVQARMLSDPRTPADVPARNALADANAKNADKANANTQAQAGLEDGTKRPGMPGAEGDPRLAVRRAGDTSWLLDWAGQLAQFRRTYLKSRPDETPDLLTTAAVIGTGVALLAGMFALYALYKYWAPH